MVKSLFASMVVGIFSIAGFVIAAENVADSASEQVPPESVRGTTASRGPQQLFQKKDAAVEQKAEPEKEAKGALTEKSDKEKRAADKKAAKAAKEAAEKAAEAKKQAEDAKKKAEEKTRKEAEKKAEAEKKKDAAKDEDKKSP